MRVRLTWPLLILVVCALSASPAQAMTRTFAGGVDTVWSAAKSVLKSDGWDLDREDRQTGTIVTDSRGVGYRNFGVYGEGARHRLKLTLQTVAAGQTSVSVTRELYKEERILWNTEKTPLKATDASVEAGILDRIARVVPATAARPSAPSASRPGTAAPGERTTPGAPASPESAPAPPPPARGGRVAKITYRVTGTGSAVDVTYRNTEGANTHQTAATLPWELSFNGKGGAPLYLSVVVSDAASASVTCEILVDGVPRSQSASAGVSAIATCGTAAP